MGGYAGVHVVAVVRTSQTREQDDILQQETKQSESSRTPVEASPDRLELDVKILGSLAHNLLECGAVLRSFTDQMAPGKNE